MIRCMPYIPLTATPLRKKNEYREMLPEDLALHPYIRCFWGSEKPYWGCKIWIYRSVAFAQRV